jgi:hypothetical protein
LIPSSRRPKTTGWARNTAVQVPHVGLGQSDPLREWSGVTLLPIAVSGIRASTVAGRVRASRVHKLGGSSFLASLRGFALGL